MKALLLLAPLYLIAHDCQIELDYSLPIHLECTGKHRLIYNEGQAKTDCRFSKKAELKEKNFGIVWGSESYPYQELTLIPLNESRVLINGAEYAGRFHCAYGKKIINDVNVDILLHNLMQKSDLNSYSTETLKALAIVLRTDLCYESKIFEAKEFGYEGTALLYQYPKITEAIVETKDLVMKLDNNLFPTTYCHDSAGTTASFSTLFKSHLTTPQGATLPEIPVHKWSKNFTKQDFAERLKVTNLKNLGFYKDKQSQKIYAVKVEDALGQRVLLVERFMQMLDLESNHFELSSNATSFSIVGKGSGLGVGLCLKTAETLSQKGQKAADILTACYPHIKIAVLDK